MSVDDQDVIDFVARDRDGTVLLIMVEGREWDGSDERLFELQEKINAYASFVAEGQLGEQYPELAGSPVRIELRCVGEPDPKTAGFLALAREELREEGLPFTIRQIGDSAAEAQRELCKRVGAAPLQPEADQKVGIALDTLHLEPLNGLRHPVKGNTCGWYIWGGTELSLDPGFFQPLHVAHLPERCPRAVKYLALPPGWRFLDAPGHEDVWTDSTLLDLSE